MADAPSWRSDFKVGDVILSKEPNGLTVVEVLKVHRVDGVAVAFRIRNETTTAIYDRIFSSDETLFLLDHADPSEPAAPAPAPPPGRRAPAKPGPVRVGIKRLRPEAVLPTYAHDGDAGMDLRALFTVDAGPNESVGGPGGTYRNDHGCGTVEITPGARVKISTGIAFELPLGYEAQVRPRSGMTWNNGLVVMFGTVDSGYRGEVFVTVFNLSGGKQTIRSGDRIAQVIIAPVVRAELAEVEELSETERGANGHGSTGR